MPSTRVLMVAAGSHDASPFSSAAVHSATFGFAGHGTKTSICRSSTPARSALQAFLRCSLRASTSPAW